MVEGAGKRSKLESASNRLKSAELVVEPRRRDPCVRATLGSDARPFGHARAAERRFVPLVRRSAGRAGLDPPRRSGSGTDPPVFYGGKPGKSLTATPIMASVARFWKLPAAFACVDVAPSQQIAWFGCNRDSRGCEKRAALRDV